MKILSLPCYLFTKENSNVVFFQRYGGEMLLLDATYKTTHYVLPLFYLAVKTNVDYQIVGTFNTENETKRVIKEVLSKLKKWKPVNIS